MNQEQNFIPQNLSKEESVKYPFKEKCPVVLLLDTSSSMSGKSIQALNQGVVQFRDALMNDDFAKKSVEVSVIGFGSTPQSIQDFCLAEDWKYKNLSASGSTAMGAAINLGIQKLGDRKRFLRNGGVNYFRPWMVMITDGYPTDMSKGNPMWNKVVANIQKEIQNGHSLPWAFGTETANMQTLKEMYGEERVFRLANANFKSIFQWLSDSLKIVSTALSGTKVKVSNPSQYTDISLEI